MLTFPGLSQSINNVADNIQNLRYEEDKLCWEFKGEPYHVRKSDVPAPLVPQDPATKKYLAERYGFLMQ